MQWAAELRIRTIAVLSAERRNERARAGRDRLERESDGAAAADRVTQESLLFLAEDCDAFAEEEDEPRPRDALAAGAPARDG
jgi:hypothetical protein